jgi:RNA polymerase sigma factor (sigma-70 family)
MTERSHPGDAERDLESTAVLVRLARDGDPDATNRLFERYYPRLRAIAHGRLGLHQRDIHDTDDLVQNTLYRAFNGLKRFEYRREGAFLFYLRKILLNEIRQEVRRHGRRRVDGRPEDGHVDPAQTPFEWLAQQETFERYDRALNRLKEEEQREAVVMRIEAGYSYEEIGRDLRKPSANAARMFVARAIARVAEHMRGSGDDPESP